MAQTLTAATAAGAIDLVISDVDGTLVTMDKVLTSAAIAAAADLARAGIGLSLISSRPPRGMISLVDRLGLTLPFAAYNGGALIAPDGRALESWPLDPAAAASALAVLEDGGVDAWVFAGDAWLLRNPVGQNVDRERRTVDFEPTVVADFSHVTADIGKIVGVSSDPARLDACEAAARARLGEAATVTRSQTYYLDIGSPAATKGAGITALCARIGAPLGRTAVIGDMFNDISMFDVAGLAIAMGQAPDAVKARAAFVTASNGEDGFAAAVRDIILPRGAGRV